MQIISCAAFAELIHAEQAVFALLLLQYFHDPYIYTTRYIPCTALSPNIKYKGRFDYMLVYKRSLCLGTEWHRST